jgi:hypothetical protein
MRRLLVSSGFLVHFALAANGTDASLAGWVPDPDGRGTLDIISSCVITFILCVWCALHLNVPPPGAKSGWFALEKAKWVLLGIFAPELVVATAASQYFTARWLKREIESDFEHQKPTGSDTSKESLQPKPWSIT